MKLATFSQAIGFQFPIRHQNKTDVKKKNHPKLTQRLLKFMRVAHRDLGYVFAGITLVYACSGLAVNHAEHWNPSYVISRQQVDIVLPTVASQVTRPVVLEQMAMVDPDAIYLSHDFPSPDRIKIYLQHGSLVATLADGHGEYETIKKRPVLNHFNRLHTSPNQWWIWFSDVFAIGLIVIVLTGVFLLRGKKGFAGRGKWLVGSGIVIPLVFMFLL